MNSLVEILRHNGHVGKDKALARRAAASLLGRPLRRIQEMAEDSRLAGDPQSVVGYSSRCGLEGLYLCVDADEIIAIREKVGRECRRRLAQLSGLNRALTAIGQAELPLDVPRTSGTMMT